MDVKLLVVFIALNVVNVILQTIKSICTVKCGKGVAALINACTYGVYTVVLVYTVCELPLWAKVLVVAAANFVGVYLVKLVEERARKDKLWEIRATVNKVYTEKLHERLTLYEIPHNYIENIGSYTIFNCYSATQDDSKKVKAVLDKFGAKYFVVEGKVL